MDRECTEHYMEPSKILGPSGDGPSELEEPGLLAVSGFSLLLAFSPSLQTSTSSSEPSRTSGLLEPDLSQCFIRGS